MWKSFFAACPEKFEIVLSGLALKEIEKIVHYSKEDVVQFFRERKISASLIGTTESNVEMSKAFIKKGVHYPDSLHAAIALNSGCRVFLTFNKKDFNAIEGWIEVREPEELFP